MHFKKNKHNDISSERMTALIDDSLYENRIGEGRTKAQRRMRQAPVPTPVVPARSHTRDAARLEDLGQQRSGITAFDGTAMSVQPQEPRVDQSVPVAATSYIGSAENMSIDPSFRGFRMADDSARVHHKTPEYMNHVGRVIERSEINPHTGRREDFYRQLPPEANRDHRVPREALENVSMKLMYAQGYDHTKPKPSRREQLAEPPQPDNTHASASTYMRMMGELQERVMRNLQMNQSGERPAWTRDSNRAFGYKGYQKMDRVVPMLPPTMRADTLQPKPSRGQTDNPNPTNELKVRGTYRDDAKKPRPAPSDWRGPAGTSEPAPPVVGEQTGDATKRAATENQFYITGPADVQHPSQASMFGEMAEQHRRNPEQIRDTQFQLSFGLTGVGAVEVTPHQPLAYVMERSGGRGGGQLAAVGSGRGAQNAGVDASASAAPAVHVSSRAERAGAQGPALSHPGRNDQGLGTVMPPASSRQSDLPEQQRASMDTNVAAKFATARQSTSMPPVISSNSQHADQRRAAVPNSLYATHASARQSTNMPPLLPAESNLLEQRRGALPHSMHASYATAQNGPALPPVMAGVSTHAENRREGAAGASVAGFSSARESAAAALSSSASGENTRAPPHRTDTAGPVPSGFGGQAESVLSSYAISRMIDHLRKHDAAPRTEHFQPPQATSTGAANTHQALHKDPNRVSDSYTLEGGDMARGPASSALAGMTAFASTNVGSQKKTAEGVVVTDYEAHKSATGVGVTVFGGQTKLDTTGKRASYGNIGTTQFSHGGGEGAGRLRETYDTGFTPDAMRAFDKGVDRTNHRNLRSESQYAQKRQN